MKDYWFNFFYFTAGVLSGGFVTALTLGMYFGPIDEPTMVQATVIEVTEVESWQTPQTLVHLEDGQRLMLPGDYGEVGDEFMVERGD